MHRLAKLALTATVALSATAAPASAAHHYSAADEQWLQAAIQGDRFEIEGGAAAQQKGTAQLIKDLGTRLHDDHSAALKVAVKLAKRLGISRPGSPTESQKWEIQTTSEFNGAAFDQHYASLETADHKDDIDEAKSEIKDGRNHAIRALAKADLKMYRAHLKLSEAALTAVGG